MADRPLTTKQKIYIEGILQGLSGVRACMKAGYKGCESTLANVASQNYKKLYIKAEIAKRRAEIEAKTDINVLYIQKEHERLARLAEGKMDLATATRNKELLGKTLGAYIDKSLVVQVNTGRRPPDIGETRRKDDEYMAELA